MFNSSKFEEIVKKYKQNRMPHAILFSTNNLKLLKDDLQLLVKNILCHEYEQDCQKECNLCTLLDNHSLPSFIEVYPEGLHIKKQQVSELKLKLSTKPIYTDCNIYIIYECDKLNASSSNSLLKFLEEPENGILGFYVTKNVDKVLSTIKSRCEIYTIQYEATESQNQYKDLIEKFIHYILDKNEDLVFCYTAIFEDLNFERMQFLELFSCMFSLFEKQFLLHEEKIQEKLNEKNGYKMLELIKNTLIKLENNVNIELAVLVFAMELRNLNE